MLSKISVKNYKAFEEAEIEFRPITILLGANSVGKSSLINLLLMLQQTASVTNYKSALRLNGERISLGEAINIYRNLKTDKPLTIEFFIKKDCISQDLLKESLSNIFTRARFIVPHYIKTKSTLPDWDYASSKSKILQACKKIIELAKNEEFELPKENDFDIIEMPFKEKSEFDRYIGQLDFAKVIISYLLMSKNEEYNLSFDILALRDINQDKEKIKDNTLKVSKMSLFISNKSLFTIQLDINQNLKKYSNIDISSDIFDKKWISKSIEQEILSKIEYESTIFSLLNSVYGHPHYVLSYPYYYNDDKPGSTLICLLFKRCIETVKTQFSNTHLSHVSPLRAYPQRYYFLDSSKDISLFNSQDGNSLAEILKENSTIKSLVNKWLKKFNLGVNVNTLHDVIHTLKIDQKKLHLDITDVGFGISQILPVIVQGFISKNQSITMIEQPEIHLHPKMQADLADLFIEMLHSDNQEIRKKSDDSKCLLIESHSEYFLRRLKRRVSEQKIGPNDIAIYYFSSSDDKESSTKVEFAEVAESGYFNYPKDFLDLEMEKDMISFIQQQIKGE